MKKLISIITLLLFSITLVFNNCYAVNANDASLDQLLKSKAIIEQKLGLYNNNLSNEETLYYNALKDEISNAISQKNTEDIQLKYAENIQKTKELMNNLESIKKLDSILYKDVANVELEIKTNNIIKQILEKELYSRTSWASYLSNLSLYTVLSAIKSGFNGALAGTFVSMFLTPLYGFNSNLILNYAISGAISTAISTALKDIKIESIKNRLDLFSGIMGNVLAGKFISSLSSPPNEISQNNKLVPIK